MNKITLRTIDKGGTFAKMPRRDTSRHSVSAVKFVKHCK